MQRVRTYIPHPEAVDELLRLLGELRVTAGLASLRSGDHWHVYAHPCPGSHAGQFNVLLCISPEPHSASHSVAGVRFELRGEDGVYRLGPNVANGRGQVWFKDLRPIAYSAWADRAELEACVPPAAAIPGLAAADTAEGRCTYQLADRRLRADLERSADSDKAVLTITTEAAELRGARVRFDIGGEEGTVVLERTDVGDLLEGSWILSQRFATVCGCVPAFHVLGKDRNGAGRDEEDTDT